MKVCWRTWRFLSFRQSNEGTLADTFNDLIISGNADIHGPVSCLFLLNEHQLVSCMKQLLKVGSYLCFLDAHNVDVAVLPVFPMGLAL